MVNSKELQNLTYKNSKWTQRIKRKIDRKIKRAGNHGRSGVFIAPPFTGDIDVFISVAKEYTDIGYWVEERYEDQSKTFFRGVWISWRKA